ncbi:hypothetical protein ACFYOY_13020 [Streptomyces sp. NPDC007875]|uniref:hypothetical protein n=1 Tax=Streptomyces sp. NPDC007875 TaxID=3364783 RepID=UPI003677DD78
MGDDRIPMTAGWLADMRRAMERRGEIIIRDVLQQPDYPPLPGCPECGRVAENITSWVESPVWDRDGDGVLVDFKPCGHRFRVSHEELLNA